jgi:hypothetical protein
LIMTASTLMHLSETKHGLPGIGPFNKRTNTFLWFDRFVSLAGIAYFAYRAYQREKISSILLHPYLWFGLLSLGISEHPHRLIQDRNKIISLHCWGHAIWHFAVYEIMRCVLN